MALYPSNSSNLEQLALKGLNISEQLRTHSILISLYEKLSQLSCKCFSKKHIAPYGALLTPKIRPFLRLSLKTGEDLFEIRPNGHAKSHADR